MPKENAHDKFFKENFSRQSVAEAFLHEVLPAKLLAQLDLTQLQLSNNSYIDTELDESFADLVYGCQLAGLPVKIALLFEHKSYVVAYPHIQLLGYLVNSLREDIKQKRKPVLVIPIIFYHGDTRWQQKPMATYYGPVSSELLPFVPEFTYVLFDLSQYPDEQINKLKDKFLATSLLLMKHRQNIDYVSQNGDQLFYWLEEVIESEEGSTYLRTVFVYLSKITKTVGRAAVDKVFGHNPMAEKFASLYDWMENEAQQRGMQKGIQQGLQQGVQQGLQQGKLAERTQVVLNMARIVSDPAVIAQMTGYPLDEVQRILSDSGSATA